MGGRGAMSEVEKLTPAQARAIETLARAYYKDKGPGRVVRGQDYNTAIWALTPQPGEAGFCEGCEWWRYEELPESYLQSFGLTRGDFPRPKWQCHHQKSRPRLCPIDRWGEKGGDTE